jgi:hypothetical protein
LVSLRNIVVCLVILLPKPHILKTVGSPATVLPSTGILLCLAHNCFFFCHLVVKARLDNPSLSRFLSAALRLCLSQSNSIQGALLAWETYVNIAKASEVDYKQK